MVCHPLHVTAQTAPPMDCTTGPITPSPEGYDINGRGKGDQQATEAAMAELAALSAADIHAMIAETKQLQKPK